MSIAFTGAYVVAGDGRDLEDATVSWKATASSPWAATRPARSS
jgi:hypothetical protein